MKIKRMFCPTDHIQDKKGTEFKAKFTIQNLTEQTKFLSYYDDEKYKLKDGWIKFSHF